MRGRACVLLPLCFIASIANASARELARGEALGWGTDVTASLAGDHLNLVGVIAEFAHSFNADLETYEYTMSFSDLVSVGSEQRSGDFVATYFLGGRFEIWRDAGHDHVFGTNPPNATAPSSFENGELYLAGTIESFAVYIHTDVGLGAASAQLVVTEGEALGLVPSQIHYRIDSTSRVSVKHPSIADGYGLQAELAIEANIRVTVEDLTWSAVKQLYRR